MCNSVEVVEGAFQYTSVDEIAFVKMCAQVGCMLVKTFGATKHIRFGADEKQFTVLREEPFTSETKKMGLFYTVKSDEEEVGKHMAERVYYVIKGSEAAVKKCLSAEQQDSVAVAKGMAQSDRLASQGLRVFSVAYRVMTTGYHHVVGALGRRGPRGHDRSVVVLLLHIEEARDPRPLQ